ncbi:tartronate semialdehyde reductase [Alkalihalobacillus alcalophilus ATCC 27647 = CGMCC 1.3604]|uniref:Tartronate semialdehyde reductase n=1 Tax=Alkalihalobacillus alcalophilus ATCC 27647 = CGMCC 1.3604 TaxID=1218173 RepID=A0A094XJ86_ALKAL|nr:2-hydroxy-3-oxopropionate reductase [Alkalihalobacillus alcalophilus]KGA98805.1 tartronate semialdehyde reductase [Alkalihalobacillus alcalophilus ATCC 27647 = CGMCC 1.3604]MED1560989.1 2-hydroxy-3-oxopropionate reductase [Alkalihalobacillus alcalophilus]THG88640.1 tartronate semialdehyde reductase [Alkalihalobacillus alcalophilus ATCC 27647 = CGMCC 1.3604]
MKKHVGFIGLGIMGMPMTKKLLKNGFSVTVFDLNEEAVNMIAKEGATPATSGKEVAENSEIVITMLPKGEHVRAALFGPNGVMEGTKEGLIIIDMSSVSPVDSKQMASQVAEKGVHFLDAPVSGGEPKAIDGTLAIMVGGEKVVFEDAKSVLEAMGTDIVLVGDSGCGTTAKLANQIIVNLNIAAVSEALTLAAKAGIDIEKMYQAIRGGLAGSTVMDAKVPMILDRNFKAGGRVDINMKDLTNVMNTAHELHVPLPLSSQLLEIFHSLVADGKEEFDHASIVQHYEKMANVVVEREENK